VTLFARIALLSLALLPCIPHAHAGQQQELENLRQRISALQQEMEKTSDTKSETADALRESATAIANCIN
jgi:septal ring factor EnvC (AmiA/AmiB activator)